MKIGIGLLLATGAVFAQAPVFEVASIRPAQPLSPAEMQPILCLTGCSLGERLTVNGARVDIRNFSIYRLIVTAYRLREFSLSPSNPNTVSRTYQDWMNSQRFDISAKIPDGISTNRIPEMLQSLLAERFKLLLHRETRQLPVYALVVGKNGPKLKAAAADADAPVPDTLGSQRVYTPQGDARFDAAGYAIAAGPFGPIRSYADRNRVIHTDFLKVTISELAEVLPVHDRPVIDMTNLTGYYQLSWERRAQLPGETDEPHVDPAVIAREALDKVGLKLEPRTAPVEVIVIDHLEKTPTEN
jgi:uncharacterized protein (TIGR03435 family)